MKSKYINHRIFVPVLILSLLVLSAPVIAQQLSINRDEVPHAVIYAIQRDFPTWDFKQTKWRAVDASKSGWTLAEAEAMRFRVKFNNTNEKTFAVYNGLGKRLSAKTISIDDTISPAVTHQLSTNRTYSGWNVIGNKQIVRDFDATTSRTKVKLERNGKKKTVIFNYTGRKISRFAALFS